MYSTTVHTSDLEYHFTFTREQIQAKGNINQLVFSIVPQSDVHSIIVTMKNETMGNLYEEITYDKLYEEFKSKRLRIEVTLKPGHGDYSGYGARTNGKKQRFWVGKSSGIIPIYLQILTKRSAGGCAVMHSCIEHIKVLPN